MVFVLYISNKTKKSIRDDVEKYTMGFLSHKTSLYHKTAFKSCFVV